MKDKLGGDDFTSNRLLTHLKQTVPFPIEKIKQIRNNVYYLKTNQRKFILKGYSTLQQLRTQEAFTASLKSQGFHQTYSFYRIQENPLFFNKKFYGWIEYIEPDSSRFTYRSKRDRKSGLDLLYAYHMTTKRLSKSYENILPHNKLYKKWYDRTVQFQKNLPILRYFLKDEYLNELLEWAKISLEGLKKENLDFGDGQDSVVLHGDVAHHNYLKSKSGKIFLIDFDLASIGFQSSDLLQYANRIFHYIDWSFNELATYSYFQKYLTNRAFLFGLMYPSDIFREWNRLIRYKDYILPKKLLPVMELTVEQFQLRKQLIKQLKNMVK